MNKAPTFSQFWDVYALKRDRFAAERAWNKLSAADKRKAIAAIPDYKADCQQRGVNRMYAQGYLNHRRWEDEFSAEESDKVSEPVVSPTDTPMKSW